MKLHAFYNKGVRRRFGCGPRAGSEREYHENRRQDWNRVKLLHENLLPIYDCEVTWLQLPAAALQPFWKSQFKLNDAEKAITGRRPAPTCPISARRAGRE